MSYMHIVIISWKLNSITWSHYCGTKRAEKIGTDVPHSKRRENERRKRQLDKNRSSNDRLMNCHGQRLRYHYDSKKGIKINLKILHAHKRV